MYKNLLALLLTANAYVAQASLVSKDFQAPGDGLLTEDTVTGLSWLDVSATVGLSYNEVSSNAGGWVGRGFRYASAGEVAVLFAHAGVAIVDPGAYNQDTVPYKALIDALGGPTTGIYSGFGHLVGMTSDDWSGNSLYGEPLHGRNSVHIAYGTPNWAWASNFSDIYDYVGDGLPQSYRGSFLVVNTASVPEPESLALFIGGLGVLGMLRRRKAA